MKKLLYTLIALLIFNTNFAQTQIGDALLPNTLTFSDNTLLLNGAGLRTKLWFNLYAAGLYLTKKNNNSEQITTMDSPMLIRLHIQSNLLSKKKMISAFKSGFTKTNTAETVAQLNLKLENFLSFITEEIKINDTYDIVYIPDTGTTLFKNNLKKGTIDGLLFKTAIFNIWLANTPIDKELKLELIKI